MPNYYNPYNLYPVTYANPIGYSGMPAMTQQSYQAPVQTGPQCAMAWVDGEIEARGRQMPQGVTQYAMWDTNQQTIYLKSMNAMGMPNPMQILRYTIEEASQMLPAGQSGDGGSRSSGVDMSNYVTREELNQLRNEIQSHSGEQSFGGSNENGRSGNNYNGNGFGNQNGSNNQQSGNRGGR